MKSITVNGKMYRSLYGMTRERLMKIFNDSKELKAQMWEIRKETFAEEFNAEFCSAWIKITDYSIVLIEIKDVNVFLEELKLFGKTYSGLYTFADSVAWDMIAEGFHKIYTDLFSDFGKLTSQVTSWVQYNMSILLNKLWEDDIAYHDEIFADLVETGDFFRGYFVADDGDIAVVECGEE